MTTGLGGLLESIAKGNLSVEPWVFEGPRKMSARGVYVPTVASALPSTEPLKQLVVRDLHGLVAPPLMRVIAGIQELREQAIPDEDLATHMAAVEESVWKILARLEVHAIPTPAHGTSLTKREVQVLTHVATGMSNKEIARQLAISQKTVRNHLSAVFGKLNSGNRTEAVINAWRAGLLTF